MDQTILVTKRLILRKFSLEDSGEVSRLVGNPNVSQETLNIPHPYSEAMAVEWIEKHQEGWRSKSQIAYAITLAKSKNLLGAIGLVKTDVKAAELGYWIGEEYWGNGYCTEACEQLIQYSFEKNLFSKITARHLLTNPASGNVMRKIGMTFVEQADGVDRNGDTVGFGYYEWRSS